MNSCTYGAAPVGAGVALPWRQNLSGGKTFCSVARENVRHTLDMSDRFFVGKS